jgi:hypothetical protein
MSAYACVAFYGLRFEVRSEEVEALENRSDERILAARKAGLKCYWANFGDPGERYFLFVGAKLGILGPEDESEIALALPQLQTIHESTEAALRIAGLTGEPSLYLQWEQDA